MCFDQFITLQIDLLGVLQICKAAIRHARQGSEVCEAEIPNPTKKMLTASHLN